MKAKRRAAAATSTTAGGKRSSSATAAAAAARGSTPLLPLLLLGLLVLAPTAAAEPTKTCVIRVGDHVMDLTPLASTQFPLEYASPDGRHTYRATLCGATPVLADSCKVHDAVAGSKSACEVYGRASQGGKPTFVDHANPQHGVTLTYAGGRYGGERETQSIAYGGVGSIRTDRF